MMENKKRLIDARAGKKVFSAIAQPAEYKGVIHMVAPISEIDKLPTVDAVEVVRCRECKHYGSISGVCYVDRKLGQTIPPIRVKHSDFCSYGERRTDG